MKKRFIAILAAVAAVIPMTGSPATATISGNITFQCTAHLDAFPTPDGSGTCSGSATVPSLGAGGLAGTSSTGAAFALRTNPSARNNFNAAFTYREACVAGEPPAAGTAEGTATISGLEGVKGGANVTAEATVSFVWTRGGATAAIRITAGTISFSDGDSATGTVGAAVAAFAPILQPNNTCPVGGPLEAVVAGSATLVV